MTIGIVLVAFLAAKVPGGWLGDCAAIGIAHKAHRLRRQQQLAETAEDMGAIGLASEIYERAAKDAHNYWS
jgi:hypothetical protein